MSWNSPLVVSLNLVVFLVFNMTIYIVNFQNANTLNIHEKHKCTKEENFYCKTCKKLICKECANLLETCKDHDHVPLAQATKIHRAELRGSVELLQTKQKEVQDLIEAINSVHRRVYAGQVSQVKGQHHDQLLPRLEEMAEKMCQIRKELYEMSLQIQQAIKEVDNTLETGSNQHISRKFANLYDNLERLRKTYVRRITKEDLTELDHMSIPKVAVQEDGIYEVNGKDLSCLSSNIAKH